MYFYTQKPDVFLTLRIDLYSECQGDRDLRRLNHSKELNYNVTLLVLKFTEEPENLTWKLDETFIRNVTEILNAFRKRPM